MKVLGGLYGWSHGRGLRQQMATEEDMTTQPCIWNPAPSKFLLLCRWWNEMVVTSIFTHQHPKTKSDSRLLALCDAYQLTSHGAFGQTTQPLVLKSPPRPGSPRGRLPTSLTGFWSTTLTRQILGQRQAVHQYCTQTSCRLSRWKSSHSPLADFTIGGVPIWSNLKVSPVPASRSLIEDPPGVDAITDPWTSSAWTSLAEAGASSTGRFQVRTMSRLHIHIPNVLCNKVPNNGFGSWLWPFWSIWAILQAYYPMFKPGKSSTSTTCHSQRHRCHGVCTLALLARREKRLRRRYCSDLGAGMAQGKWASMAAWHVPVVKDND